MNNETSRDRSARSDRTQLDGKAPGPETVRDARARPEAAGSPPPRLQPLPGALSADFKVREDLATKGAEADLFVVERLSDGQPFLAKIYRRGISVKIELLDRVARADPAHVVKVVAHGLSDGRYYELQEYVALGSLADLIAQEGPPLAPGLVKDILHELLIALRHLHGSGIAHRDLKPANVLVRQRRPLDLVLTDFGISSLMHDESVRFSTGDRTIAYSAPESDSGMVTLASDYWSLGMMVAEIVSGEHPYAGLRDQVISGNKATRPVPLPEMPEPWLKLCRGLLQRDPQQRWGSDQVDRWLEGDTTLPEPVVERFQAAAGPLVRPCHFLGKEYDTPEDLAAAMASNWNEGLRYLVKNYLRDWYYKDLGNQELALFVDDLEGDARLSDHHRLFRVIGRTNPALPPSFRGILLNKANLANLARGAMKEDSEAQDVLKTLFAGNILSELTGDDNRAEIVDLGRRWSLAESQYGELLRKAKEKGASPQREDFQVQGVRLALLLLGVLDPEFVVELRHQTRGIVTKQAREVKWYAELGDPDRADAAALLLMRELLKSAEEQALRQREIESRHREQEKQRLEAERLQQIEQALEQRRRTATAQAHLVMFAVSLATGFLLWLFLKNSPLWALFVIPSLSILAGYVGAEIFTSFACRLNSGWGALGMATAQALLGTIVLAVGFMVVYLVLYLLLGLVALLFPGTREFLGSGGLRETFPSVVLVLAFLALWGLVDTVRDGTLAEKAKEMGRR